MKIVNCAALTRGELLGRPSFSAFEEIKVSVSQINRGDLFIASDPKEIGPAILKGAYGIMYDFDYEITDEELAWIRVRNTKNAAQVIAKYLLLKKHISYVFTDKITFDIAKSINIDNKVAFLEAGDLRGLFSAIKNDDKLVYISCDDGYLQELTSENIEAYFTHKDRESTIFSSNMFETTFIEVDRGVVVKLPLFMMKFLRNAQKIYTELELNCELSNAKSTQFFDPVFVDDSLKERDFGKTSKVIIFADFVTASLLKESIDFIKNNGRWGRLLFLLPSELIGFEHGNAIVTHFGSNEELSDMLESDFNFALVINGDRNIVTKDKKEQLSLF